MIRINVEIEDLKSVCYVASFYISVLFPVNPLHLHGGLLPHDFLFHLFRRSNLSIDFIWIAICLLEKLHTSIGKQEQIGSVYKLIVAAIILAHKSHSDIVLYNSEWCKYSAYTLEQINRFELEMFSMIGSNTTIDTGHRSRFFAYLSTLLPGSTNTQSLLT